MITRAASELGLPSAEPTELALAYADVFLLNVYPYGTAFTDPGGELNAPAAQRVAALYEAHGYRPAELTQVGAPDHLGLCLGFMASVGQDGILSYILEWAPVCCFAVEREPSAHRFYRALAARTREMLLANIPPLDPPIHPSSLIPPSFSGEVRLKDIVRFFLAPARCGMFLSRSRLGQMAKALGMRLPFGSRFEVAEMLFGTAGEIGQVAKLLGALEAEAEYWASAYQVWLVEYPAWQPYGTVWLERIDRARQMLTAMRQTLESPLELEFEVHDATDFG
jgi:hypothetical protein